MYIYANPRYILIYQNLKSSIPDRVEDFYFIKLSITPGCRFA